MLVCSLFVVGELSNFLLIDLNPFLARDHVWTAPLMQGFFDCDAHGRVRPCVRPVCAAVSPWPR